MTKISDLQKGNSPYAKYNKAPFKYSDEYYEWAAAVDATGIASDRTITADEKFRRRFNVPAFNGLRVEFE